MLQEKGVKMELTKEDLDKMQKDIDSRAKLTAINQFVNEAIKEAIEARLIKLSHAK